jgi:CheY-like chemotaxis protein
MARILIVDDDQAVRATITLLLHAAGHEVVAASDGRGGIAKCESEQFDLLIVDIFMPGMDGLETIQRICRQKPNLPIIVMSGLNFRSASPTPPDFLTMATKLGAARALRKPFRPSELHEAVHDCLNRSPDAGRNSIGRPQP